MDWIGTEPQKTTEVTAPKVYLCVSCKKRTQQANRRFLTGLPDYVHYLKVSGTILDESSENFKFSCTCTKCYLHYYRKCKTTSQDTRTSENTTDEFAPSSKKICSPQCIPLPIISSGNSHSTCCVCRRRGVKFITVPTECRYRLFIEKCHLLAAGTRCCPGHIVDNYFNVESLERFQEGSVEHFPSMFNKTEISSLISNIRTIALRNSHYRINFDSSSDLNDNDFVVLTGLSKEDFNDLCSYVTSIRCTKNRTSQTAVALLLVKLRTGMSNRLLSTLFNIDKASVRRAIVSARNCLTSEFTSKFVGFGHVSRQEVIENHTRPLAQTLFGEMCKSQAILVADGTYIYIQKSNNFKFQRRSYSLHKNRPLVKPMMIVSTTGYIVSVLGPYFADSKNNDASILKHNFLTNKENICDWVQPDDIMIVDRGFRDSLDFLESLGIEHKMPSFLPKGQKQHTVEEANASRLVTKVRWVVESANARLKQWKYLANVVPNTQIPYIHDYVRLVAAICNKYKRPLNSGQADDVVIAAKMKFLSKKKNDLQERVIAENLDKRNGKWKLLDAQDAVLDFPKLSEDELREITIGVYQLKLAKSYSSEHIDTDGDYLILLNEDMPGLLKVSLQSRHTSSKKYTLWIEYANGFVKSWYCQCKAGARVVGSCSHVSAVIWYLSFARYGSIHSTKEWSKFVEDALDVPTVMDESDVSEEE